MAVDRFPEGLPGLLAFVAQWSSVSKPWRLLCVGSVCYDV